MEFLKIAFVDFVEEFLWRNGGIGIIITRPSLALSLSQWRGSPSEANKTHAAATEQREKTHGCVCEACLFICRERCCLRARALRAAARCSR
jgi:hypothetical protein